MKGHRAHQRAAVPLLKAKLRELVTSQRTENSGYTSTQPPSALRELIKRRERDFFHEQIGTGQGAVVLN